MVILTLDQATTEEKDLGIWFDPSLKFSIHIASAVKKANQILGLIRIQKIFQFPWYQSDEAAIYTVMVRPHLEYGNIVWHPQLKLEELKQYSVEHQQEIWASAHETRHSISLILYAGCLGLSPVYFSENSL